LIPVLSHANLKPSDLITLSDLPSATERSSQLNPDKTRWLLVDHNALQGELGKIYGTRLVGCVDHHDEEGKVPKESDDEPRIVQKSGSCSSLVVESCKEAWDALSGKSTSKEEKTWDTELAYLALAPVLIDTTNLTIESKVTPADTDAVKYLESRISDLDPDFDAEKYFEELSAAKHDIGGLSLRDILRKDYKQWNEAGSTIVGISSVVKDLQFLIKKAGSEDEFSDASKEFAKERDLSVFSIMTTANHDGEFRRELCVWGLNDKGIEVVKKFQTDSTEKLGLEKWGSLDADENGQLRRCWWQNRVENSRKQVAPLLRTAVTEKQ
jgi:exopolyphosphatase